MSVNKKLFGLGMALLFAVPWVWPLTKMLNITSGEMQFAIAVNSMLIVFSAVGFIIDAFDA